MFSDILLTADFDRTTSGPEATVPRRNREAIEYFMANGGAFTLNTGRSLPNARPILPLVPVNAPVLMYNGSAAYDPNADRLSTLHPIELDLWETVSLVRERFPELVVEMQGLDTHYIFEPNPMWEAYRAHQGCPYTLAAPGQDLGPFVKLALYAPFRDWQISELHRVTAEETARLEAARAFLEARFPGKLSVFRPTAKAVDLQAAGVSKASAARELQKKLGRKILVCVGDAENDISMLRGADYAFCPADGVVADQFPNVCSCADGAVADVIYEKLPQILAKSHA